MWKKYKVFIISGLILIAIGFLETLKPRETLWIESYSKFDKIPYGSLVLHSELEHLFTQSIVSSFESLNTALNDTLFQTNLIVINNNFMASESDVNALLNFVNEGNQAMIISRNISDQLLDTLGLSTAFELSGELKTPMKYSLKEDTTQYTGQTYNTLFQTYFDSLSTAAPLGYRSDGEVNFVGKKFGAGKLYIHVLPSAFTNVFMLNENNDEYISGVLSYLPDQTTIWDEYYKARKNYVVQTPFQQVLTTEGLWQALYIVLFGSFIYMIFASKRRQRPIPILAKKSNSTVEFIETMGQLYFNVSDHKDIGQKRSNYFLADIRERYRIDTEELDEDFSNKLSVLSGVPRDEVDKLTANFKVINSVAVVLNERIVEQDELIENYYNKERSYGK